MFDDGSFVTRACEQHSREKCSNLSCPREGGGRLLSMSNRCTTYGRCTSRNLGVHDIGFAPATPIYLCLTCRISFTRRRCDAGAKRNH